MADALRLMMNDGDVCSWMMMMMLMTDDDDDDDDDDG